MSATAAVIGEAVRSHTSSSRLLSSFMLMRCLQASHRPPAPSVARPVPVAATASSSGFLASLASRPEARRGELRAQVGRTRFLGLRRVEATPSGFRVLCPGAMMGLLRGFGIGRVKRWACIIV